MLWRIRLQRTCMPKQVGSTQKGASAVRSTPVLVLPSTHCACQVEAAAKAYRSTARPRGARGAEGPCASAAGPALTVLQGLGTSAHVCAETQAAAGRKHSTVSWHDVFNSSTLVILDVHTANLLVLRCFQTHERTLGNVLNTRKSVMRVGLAPQRVTACCSWQLAGGCLQKRGCIVRMVNGLNGMHVCKKSCAARGCVLLPMDCRWSAGDCVTSTVVCALF